MKRCTAAAFFLFFLFSLSANAFADSYGSAELARNGVVRVCTTGDIQIYSGRTLLETLFDVELSFGSAFAVGEKGAPVSYFVTNRHVISKKTESFSIETLTYRCIPKNLYIILDNEGTLHPIEIITDNEGGPDLAIIKLKEATTQREALCLNPYRNAAALRTSTVYSVGFPGSQTSFLDESHQNASGTDMVSVRKGAFDHEVNGQHTAGEGTLILTDVPMSSGNSGGPLVDEKGGVLGVCALGSREDAGMNAAISVNELVELLEKNNVPYMTVQLAERDHRTVIVYTATGLTIAAAVLAAVLLRRKRPEHAVESIPSPAPKPFPEPVPPPARKPDSAPVRTLVCVAGPLKDRRYELKAGQSVYIGRDAGRCRVLFPNGTPGVSRIHCLIRFDGRGAAITDCGSSYGTYVGGNRIASNTAVPLHRGYAIDIGSDQIRFTLQ